MEHQLTETEAETRRDGGARTRDVVVVGASAGGVEALRTFVAALPPSLPASLLVVLHVPATSASALPQILERAGSLPARHARDGDPLTPGTILVAPPDRHLLVYGDAVALSHGPNENGHRPAVDTLFRSAARDLGSRVIAVILSGALDDGAAGMVAVRERGGLALAQDPSEALHGSMPRAAIAAGGVDLHLPVHDLAMLIAARAGEPAPGAPEPSELMRKEAAVATLDPLAIHTDDPPGEPAGLSCPDCHGSLFQITEGALVRFRCRVGHAWSPASLLAQQSTSHESALWMALRSLEEKAALTRELGRRADDRGHTLSAGAFHAQAAEAHRAAGLVRELIDEIGAGPGVDTEHDVRLEKQTGAEV